MAEQRTQDSNPMFAKAFLPGLVLGVIVGLGVGVFASPLLFDRSPALKSTGGMATSNTPRDARPAPKPAPSDSATPANPKPGEPMPENGAGDPKKPDPNKPDPTKPDPTRADPGKPAPDPAKAP